MKKIWKLMGTAKSTELVFARGLKSAQKYAKESAEYRFNTCLKKLGLTDCDLYIYNTDVKTRNHSNGSYNVALYANVYAEFDDLSFEELSELVVALPIDGFAGFNIGWEEQLQPYLREEPEDYLDEIPNLCVI